MFTIDEYIAKMKKSDKIDEFDFSHQAENMSAIMKYVMSYFNEYLTMETCDSEQLKSKHVIDKLEEEADRYYPLSKPFIISFYLDHKIRIDKVIEKRLSQIEYYEFFYSKEDFMSLAEEFCSSYKIKGSDMNQHRDEISVLFEEMKKQTTEKPSPSEMIHLDNNIVSWVQDTYRSYGVNLFTFGSELAESYYDKYVKYERSQYGDTWYHINSYNHRYNSNPFQMDQIFEDNKHRPFLENRRGELEMIVMHEWIFTSAHDEDYWPEYVNLCISRARVTIVRNINALIAVAAEGLAYPDDVPCYTKYIISHDGILKNLSNGDYILRIDSPDVFQSSDQLAQLTENLIKSFSQYSIPKVLELGAPIKTMGFNEETFLALCSVLEKKMKRFSPMKLSIVNGPGNNRSKPNSYLSSMEDLIKLRTKLRDRKVPIKFSLDFSLFIQSNRNSHIEGFEFLNEMRNSIICIYVENMFTAPQSSPRPKRVGDNNNSYYLQKFQYPEYDDLYSSLSSTLCDNHKRYIIPKNVKNNIQLEGLVDNLLRSGFAFTMKETNND